MKLATKIFKFRSYTPIPFFIVMIIFEQANIISMLGGFIIALSGELMRIWGVSWAGSETRTTGKVGGTFLIISGPFAHVRNPLYVGNILIYLGIGIMSWALIPYLQIAALIFFLLQYHFIVKEEENYLMNTYKEDYKKYLKNVPRFGWKINAYIDESIIQPEFNFGKGINSDKRTLQALFIVTIIIIIKWYLRISGVL